MQKLPTEVLEELYRGIKHVIASQHKVEEAVYQYYAEHPQEVDAEVEEFLYKSELLIQQEQQLLKIYEQEFARRGVTP